MTGEPKTKTPQEAFAATIPVRDGRRTALIDLTLPYKRGQRRDGRKSVEYPR